MKRALRVAIAEDEEDMQRFLAGALTRLGHDVIGIAGTGTQLVEICRSSQPDIVLTDIKMPDMDGLEAARRIYREVPVPIIVVTAHHDPEFVDRAAENHIAAYLVKPIKASHLGPAISIVMKRFQEFLELRKESEDLRQALEDRKVIEKAKGLLMREAHLDEDAAFRRLQKLASQKNLKLAALARRILDTADALKPQGEPPTD